MQIRRNRRPRRRGAVILFFLLVALPLVWVAGALAVDYSNVITTRQQAEMLLDAASIGAAMEIRTGDCGPEGCGDVTGPYGGLEIEPVLANQAAEIICNRALEAGAGRALGEEACRSGLTVQVDDAGLSVTVTLRYQVSGLMFLGFFDSGESLTSIEATSSSTSRVCVGFWGETSELDPVNGGACSRTR